MNMFLMRKDFKKSVDLNQKRSMKGEMTIQID